MSASERQISRLGRGRYRWLWSQLRLFAALSCLLITVGLAVS
jgi:hypothetical protein